MTELEELKKLLERADFGRLSFVQTDEDYGYIEDDNRGIPLTDGPRVDCGLAIVAAVNALPGMIARVEEAEAEVAALKDLCAAAGELYRGGGTYPIKGAMSLRLLKAGAALRKEP